MNLRELNIQPGPVIEFEYGQTVFEYHFPERVFDSKGECVASFYRSNIQSAALLHGNSSKPEEAAEIYRIVIKLASFISTRVQIERARLGI